MINVSRLLQQKTLFPRIRRHSPSILHQRFFFAFSVSSNAMAIKCLTGDSGFEAPVHYTLNVRSKIGRSNVLFAIEG